MNGFEIYAILVASTIPALLFRYSGFFLARALPANDKVRLFGDLMPIVALGAVLGPQLTSMAPSETIALGVAAFVFWLRGGFLSTILTGSTVLIASAFL